MTQEQFKNKIKNTIRVALFEKETIGLRFRKEDLVTLVQADLIALAKIIQYKEDMVGMDFFIHEGIRDLSLLYWSMDKGREYISSDSILNQELYAYEIEKKCTDIVSVKNEDYAKEHDPFLNFRKSVLVGSSPSDGILVRLQDKITRMGNLLDKEPSVKDEKREDTLIDTINYLAILKAYLKEYIYE